MPPASRICQDPSRAATTGAMPLDDFQAAGPTLCILQLNVEGLSAAKCSIADQHNVDVICLQETHTDTNVARFTIHGSDLVSSHLHAKHERAVYTRDSLVDVSYQYLTTYCHIIKVEIVSIANVYRPPSEPWPADNLLPTLPHTATLIGAITARAKRARCY